MKIVFRDADLVVNGVNFSQWVREANANLSREQIESTGMQAPGKEYLTGDRVDSFDFTLAQDFDADAVDATLWPLFEAGSEFVVELKHKNADVSTTNPRYVGTCTLIEYQPMAGARNTLLEIKVTMPIQGAATRETT